MAQCRPSFAQKNEDKRFYGAKKKRSRHGSKAESRIENCTFVPGLVCIVGSSCPEPAMYHWLPSGVGGRTVVVFNGVIVAKDPTFRGQSPVYSLKGTCYEVDPARKPWQNEQWALMVPGANRFPKKPEIIALMIIGAPDNRVSFSHGLGGERWKGCQVI
ncbi:hypothetical protein EV356DRAFT_569608 [Viridothelium virens]|uniref:Uncharacterized protein n=1 Tax=Viridothelium virens TaxID=1048519 RepID=A0A6A6H098_VIRVR|nr:hypothetical protein EV356DRAFT_569608 [Viridothelium virens]